MAENEAKKEYYTQMTACSLLHMTIIKRFMKYRNKEFCNGAEEIHN